MTTDDTTEPDVLTVYRRFGVWRWRYHAAGIHGAELAARGESCMHQIDAVAAALRVCGILHPDDHAIDLPFYRSGGTSLRLEVVAPDPDFYRDGGTPCGPRVARRGQVHRRSSRRHRRGTAVMLCVHPFDDLHEVKLWAVGGAGELVAKLCGRCGQQLPVAFGCPDCDYTDVIAYELDAPLTRLLTRPCSQHKDLA